MAFNLYDIAESRQEELSDAIAQAKGSSSDTEKLHILLSAIENVRSEIASVAIDEVTVSNMSDIKAHLRNELNRISKPIIQAIDKLSLDKKKIDQIKTELERKNTVALEENYDIQTIRKPKSRFVIDNLSDIAFPDSFRVRNIGDIQQYFDNLAGVIRETFKIEIPTPQVHVESPVVNVPEQSISIPPVDLSPLLASLDPLKFLSDRPNKPLSVRLSDGNKFMQTIRTIIENQERQATAFSQGLNEASATKAFKKANRGVVSGSGALELTSAGTAVQITATSTPCKWVDISTNAGLANIGASTAVQTSDAEVGVTIYPGNLPYRVETDNLNKVYAAGASGTRISWTYYV